MYKDSLYSVRKYFQSIYEVFSKYIWRTVIQQETNKPVSERGKEPFLTGLPCDYVQRYKEDTLVLCFVVIQNSSPLCLLWQCFWRCLFSRCLDRQAAEGWGCLGRWRDSVWRLVRLLHSPVLFLALPLSGLWRSCAPATGRSCLGRSSEAGKRSSEQLLLCWVLREVKEWVGWNSLSSE